MALPYIEYYADEMANSVDPDQTAQSRSSRIWVCTICPYPSVWKLRNMTVHLEGQVLFVDCQMVSIGDPLLSPGLVDELKMI